jgi:uncharacterized protein with PIN domain
MPNVYVSVLEELNNLLPKRNRFKELEIEFKGRQSVKHIIESLGIPHTEIGFITINENQVDFDYLVQDEDRVIVQPAMPDKDHYSGMFNEGKLVIEPRFILDNHLGKLATYLRILGFDAIYHNDFQDDELAHNSVDLNRILLTRDRQLLMRKTIRFGYLIRALEPDLQVIEVLNRFNLAGVVKPFNRCLRCNTSLAPVEKETILDRLQPKTKKYFDEFHICPQCERIYWMGSHYECMDRKIADLLDYSAHETRT